MQNVEESISKLPFGVGVEGGVGVGVDGQVFNVNT